MSPGKAKRMKMLKSGDDQSYFDSYSDITVHEEMLGDEVRTNTYKEAIFSCEGRIRNKVVLDVGAGTGILSCFCAQAGAKKVFAVEASDIAKQAMKVVDSNGLSDKIQVIQGLVEDIMLPEKVDVIVSEWMGYCLLYESMLESVIVARDRWLKPGGLILPSLATLYLTPVCDDEIVVEKVNFWNDMKDVYGVDMSAMLPFARSSMSKDVMVKTISCENILSQPQILATFNLYKVTKSDIQLVEKSFKFQSYGLADFQGFALWFDVFFPIVHHSSPTKPRPTSNGSTGTTCNSNNSSNGSSSHSNGTTNGASDTTHNKEELKIGQKRPLPPSPTSTTAVANKYANGYSKCVVLSTSPYKPETHWKQSLLYLNDGCTVQQDSMIDAKVTLTPCKENKRFLNIALTCQVDDDPPLSKSYFMGYEVPDSKRYHHDSDEEDCIGGKPSP